MLPPSVQFTMKKLCDLLESKIPNVIESMYLYGSVALDAFIEGSSDIDFIAVLNRTLSNTDILAISEVHKDLERLIPKADIMGSYIQSSDLGKSPQYIPNLISYYNKEIHTLGKGADLNPVTWWILRKRGICIYGKPINLTFDIEINSLLQYVKNNMNTYWVGWIERFSNLNFDETDVLDSSIQSQLDEAVEWCVLGMLRQLYTIREHDITSKIGAGHYGLEIFSQKWHALMLEAISIKEQRLVSHYKSQSERHHDLIALLKMIHAECNK